MSEGGGMTKPQAKRSTTAEAPATAEPANRRIGYGDPVIVDDGGSTRIEQRGKQWSGGSINGAGIDAIGSFGANALLCVCSVTQNGPLCASLRLSNDHVVKIVSTHTPTPGGASRESTVTLSIQAGKLTVKCDAAADPCAGKGGKGHNHFHAPDTGTITAVRHIDQKGTTTVLLEAAVHGATLATFVSVHPAT